MHSNLDAFVITSPAANAKTQYVHLVNEEEASTLLNKTRQ